MLPFRVNPLPNLNEEDRHCLETTTTGTAALLPAAYCDRSFRMRIPTAEDEQWFAIQLRVDRLNSIHDWFFIIGLPRPPRPLHRQLLMFRDIVITEEPELHLVWTSRRIFIKPLPRFLLSPDFWQEHLLCEKAYECCSTKSVATKDQLANSIIYDGAKICHRRELYQLALGFLISYAALVANESDFHIAREHHLLPDEIRWPQWRLLCSELLSKPSNQININRRYRYGELRLNRLNDIYRFRKGFLVSGFLHNYEYDSYASFLQLNAVRVLSVITFMIAILTAFQTGLAVDKLASSSIFQDVSFTVVLIALIAPSSVFLLGFLVCGCVFLRNVIATHRHHRMRG